MKKLIITAAAVLISLNVNAASITSGFGYTVVSGSGEYSHYGQKVVVTTKKSTITSGNTVSKTNVVNQLHTHKYYDGATTYDSVSVNSYVGSGGLSEGVVLTGFVATDKVTGWGGQNNGKGLETATFGGVSETVSTTPNGKETVTTYEGWQEDKLFEQEMVTAGFSATAYVE